MQRNTGEHRDNKGQDEPIPVLTTTATEETTATATAKPIEASAASLTSKLSNEPTHIEKATKKTVPRMLLGLDASRYGTKITNERPSRKCTKRQSDVTASKATTTSATDKTSSARLTKSVKNNEHDGSFQKKNNQSKASKRKLTTKKSKKKQSNKKKINKNNKPIKRPIIPGSGQILHSGSWVHSKKKSTKVTTIKGIEGFVHMLTGRKTSDLVETQRCENEAISLCQTVNLGAYSFARVRGGTKMPDGGIQLGVKEDYNEKVASTSSQVTDDEYIQVLVTYGQANSSKTERFETFSLEVISAVVRTAYSNALTESITSGSDKRLTPLTLAQTDIFWPLVYFCTNGGVIIKNIPENIPDMLRRTFKDLDWGHLERNGRMKEESDLTKNQLLQVPLPDLMRRERQFQLDLSENKKEKYHEVIKLSALALGYLNVANDRNESQNKNLIANALFIVKFSLGDDFQLDHDDDDSDDDDSDDDDSDDDDSDDDDSDSSDDDDDNLMYMSLKKCKKILGKCALIINQYSLDETFIDMIIRLLEFIRCLFYQTADRVTGNAHASVACLQGAGNAALSLIGNVRGPGTMLIATLTSVLSAWLAHHDEEAMRLFLGKMKNEGVGVIREHLLQSFLMKANLWHSELESLFSLYCLSLGMNGDKVVPKDMKDTTREFIVDLRSCNEHLLQLIDEMKTM
jgi:hypothetical protein